MTPESFPELHAEIVRLQAMLDYHRPIDVYVADEVDGKMTITSLLGTRVLLIEGGFAADLQAEGAAPLRFLLVLQQRFAIWPGQRHRRECSWLLARQGRSCRTAPPTNDIEHCLRGDGGSLPA
ncbi:hypothetical protein SAMN05216532_0095 [Streptomyces sp. 2231.1]|nr:hypothetical protein SAMN05216532_0095 [Streptomyces sp. 2231.1]